MKRTASRSALWMTLAGGASLLFSCAGTTKEPSNPDTEPPPVEEVLGQPAPPQEERPEEEPSNQDPDLEEASNNTGGSVSPQDLNEALQIVLSDDALLNQLDLGAPGRFPLQIAGKDIPTNAELQALTQQVQVVSAPDDPKDEPILIFTSIELSPSSGTFKYRYPAEGVRGTSYVIRAHNAWVLKSSRVSQY